MQSALHQKWRPEVTSEPLSADGTSMTSNSAAWECQIEFPDGEMETGTTSEFIASVDVVTQQWNAGVNWRFGLNNWIVSKIQDGWNMARVVFNKVLVQDTDQTRYLPHLDGWNTDGEGEGETERGDHPLKHAAIIPPNKRITNETGNSVSNADGRLDEEEEEAEED